MDLDATTALRCGGGVGVDSPGLPRDHLEVLALAETHRCTTVQVRCSHTLALLFAALCTLHGTGQHCCELEL